MKDIRKKDIDVVKRFRADLTLAANKICGVNVPWWQRHWLKGTTDASISYIIACRGSGKSYFIALSCVLRALLFPKERVGIVSNSYRQSQMVFNHVMDRIESSPHIIASLKGKPNVGLNECKVLFQNGSSIRALPLGDGSKIRSARFHTLVIDEFQDIDQEIVDTVILPFLNVKKNPVSGMLISEGEAKGGNSNKNRLIIVSTAKYKHDDAYTKYALIKERAESGNDKYFHSIINLDDLRTLPGWIDEEVISLEQQTMSKTKFLMESYGVWAETGEGFFDAIACENMKDLKVKFLDQPRPGCQYIMGVDPAKSSANFVITLLEWDGEKSNLVYINAFTREEVPMAVETMKYLHKKFACWVYMDARGGGIWVADELTKTEVSATSGLGVSVTEGINPTQLVLVQTAHPLIDNMNWALKAAIENGQIKVPAVADETFSSTEAIAAADKRTNEVNELISELQSIIQRQLAQEVQYTTENKNALKDRYCAFMYAYWGIVERFISDPYNEDDLVIMAV